MTRRNTRETQHRLAAEYFPGAVASDQHQREPCGRVVMEVAEELDALAGKALCLVDDHHPRGRARVWHQQPDHLVCQPEPGTVLGI